MGPRIQYARTSDGVRIAFWKLGEGLPFVHLTPGTTDIVGEWEMPECRAWYESLASSLALVRYNSRGEGQSDHAVSERLLEDALVDLEAVVNAAATGPFILFGAWYGGPVAITYAARHPERVAGLILFNTFARGQEWGQQPQMQAVRSLVDKDWVTYTEAVAHVILGWSEGEPARRYAAVLRESVTPEYVQNFYEQVSSWDVTSLLSEVSVPTLVLHRRDHSLGIEVARTLAKGIPDSRLIILDGSSTAPYLGDSDALLRAINEFAMTIRPQAASKNDLSEREIEVLGLVAAGRSNREIGEQLSISVNTVDRHVSNIMAKIGASNRAEAASYAVRSGLA